MCNFHRFGGPQVLKTLTKQWEIDTAHNDKKVLKKKKTFILESVIFVRPVARQKSEDYKLRMILKVAYCETLGEI